VEHVTFVHAQADRDLQRFDRIVSTIWIARVVSLAHSADDVASVPAVTYRRCDCQKEQVSTGDERIRQAGLRKFNLALACEGCVADFAENPQID
jgi:hypothetical protein